MEVIRTKFFEKDYYVRFVTTINKKIKQSKNHFTSNNDSSIASVSKPFFGNLKVCFLKEN